ncbi:hypothetical protein LSH36_1g05016 [Paralvinella palmiformis]|uniref:Calpain catalytic domain-containing protein n=1 Tax=Paralvinella palmiformis TaxID=53620 RepID=A0AAD9KGG2_9ANNE|nr:hypothetical protein LSH36_1g05016 [Paralvinella palmiformis]
MTDPKALEQDAVSFAQRAVQCDEQGLFDTAIFYYTEATQALVTAASAGSKVPNLITKSYEYTRRVDELKALKVQHDTSSPYVAPVKTKQQQELDRARYLIEQAFEEDEAGNREEAFELYTQAAELCLNLRQDTNDKEAQAKITKLATLAVERAEQLKKSNEASLGPLPPLEDPTVPTAGRSPKPVKRDKRNKPLGTTFFDDDNEGDTGTVSKKQVAPPKHGGPTSTGGSYSREEIQVLRITSYINSREYVPFMAVDKQERFAYPLPFTDKHGMLALSPKQRQKLSRWARPDEFCNNPQMIYAVSSFSIKQTIVSDCSFVASLAIAAQYERRFKRKLITSIIYPQNRKGEPQYNPCGKYMVKLNLNGVPRKVIVDDFLPLTSHGDLLCSYSNNRNELWVSLLEKAYMKVMGGYDFPGSNSNIDLHALTSWIPERVAIRPGSDQFDADKEFTKVQDRFHKGHCLVTMATGDMSEAEADRAGLVPTHAYAMLDIRIAGGHKLILLKNPWSHLRWRGNFSEMDTIHWTEELKRQLNFDPKQASVIDNGIFWIDYESILRFFDVMYINWQPELFPHTTCMHHTWTARDGPRKDAYNIGDNPQYKLEVKAPGPSAVWILLTRHITDKEDFANNKKFITVLVYKSNGQRIFYPYDPPPYKDGVRINSPHYLVKMIEEKGTSTYTLVISQYEKNDTIHYTLRVYATCEFKMAKISEPYDPKLEKHITGQWKGQTAGGCSNYLDTHHNNPIYQLQINNNNANNMILIELRGPKEYSVGFSVVTVSENVPDAPGSFKKKTSGDFRRGFCVLELDNVPGGVYNISPCTFYQKQEGPFFLDVSSSVPISVKQLQ